MLENWYSFIRPLGMESSLQDTTYQQQVWCLTIFAACKRLVRYDHGKQVLISTVSGKISAVGKAVSLAYEGNPIKAQEEKTVSAKAGKTYVGMEELGPTH